MQLRLTSGRAKYSPDPTNEAMRISGHHAPRDEPFVKRRDANLQLATGKARHAERDGYFAGSWGTRLIGM